ncbi:conserved hypothetical protein [Cellulomonas flavigena DSM 20109]|uniref:Uncharacterized protein n=1 Tax=Cellulomonas flavigena (strain ATCC 482 / DSM 20109 / BCRC 11376 / JCM 18109 / NBRC 3775 / NCIMB 8073 / NRS 134) TaxID=446466 RepID=D5UID6_CELFN|nr:hypothetical protein [Cellulomonas flavigena]ADG75481.1 conserved hypothetical protein [Cellulomonas flavigena DSM 20109]
MTTTHDPRTRMRLREQLRLDWWLLRFELAMQDYPAREARRIRRELRASVIDDARRAGLDTALRDLGSPRRLAAAYFAELDRERPRWTDGALLGGILGILVPGYMWLSWQLGALDAIDAMGGGTVELSWLGTPAILTHTEDTVSMQSTLGWGPVVLALVLTSVFFALGSRIWRLRSA